MEGSIVWYVRFVLVAMWANCAPVCPVGGMKMQKS